MAVVITTSFVSAFLDEQSLTRRVGQIVTKYATALDRQLKEEIKAPVYRWPGPTKRRNGATVTSPRDIVDTGAFLRSQVRRRVDATTVKFTWGNEAVTYAGIILKGKGNNYPARDWISRAFDKLPFDRFFTAEWQRTGGTAPRPATSTNVARS